MDKSREMCYLPIALSAVINPLDNIKRIKISWKRKHLIEKVWSNKRKQAEQRMMNSLRLLKNDGQPEVGEEL